jgi:hypothetical protein
MSQLNIQTTPSFERDLRKFMQVRHIQTKTEAIRTAIKEGLQHPPAQTKTTNFSTWIGLALQEPVNKKAKRLSDDDLWG